MWSPHQGPRSIPLKIKTWGVTTVRTFTRTNSDGVMYDTIVKVHHRCKHFHYRGRRLTLRHSPPPHHNLYVITELNSWRLPFYVLIWNRSFVRFISPTRPSLLFLLVGPYSVACVFQRLSLVLSSRYVRDLRTVIDLTGISCVYGISIWVLSSIDCWALGVLGEPHYTHL